MIIEVYGFFDFDGAKLRKKVNTTTFRVSDDNNCIMMTTTA